MKAKLAALMLLAVPLLQAQDQGNWREGCNSVSKLAESIMKARQNGVPMRDIFNILHAHSTSESFTAISNELVIAAYEEPHWSTESNKTRAARDFSDRFYLACVKQFQ